jgi:hypothetical protein
LGYNLKRVVKLLGFSEIMARLDSVSQDAAIFFHRFKVILGIRKILLAKASFLA